ncbi:hypothetical protein ACOSQ3_004950 [Xanthoceras sorbifolium]
MTSTSSLFHSYTPCAGNKKVKIADGSLSSIAGKGSIKISNKIELKSVIHVPNLSCNLLSVSKLSQDSNCLIIFYPTKCEFQDMAMGKMIGSAEMKDGLYYFEDSQSNMLTQGLNCNMNSIPVKDQIMMWHLRLGNPSFAYLKHLFPSLFQSVSIKDFQYDTCCFSKSTSTPYYYSKPYRSSQPFYHIHSDVWGPSNIPTLSGKWWFVTFIDDHTHLCWIYLMNTKSEVEKHFKTFFHMVENQFQTKISILRSDNGTEFFNQHLSSFLTENDIQHQSTCRNTPQQNGIVERKNRHLLEVSRALMLSMNVPKYLWGEAVLTATYLINRVPSRVLKHDTPLHYLKNYFPTNRLGSSLPLKIFGCTVFVHQPRLSQSKLDARAEKCVFIGYAPSQKGYKCFNPSNRRTYVSMDVKFLENQSFFTNHLQGANHKKDEIQQVSNFIPAGPLSSGSGLAPFLDFPKPDACLFDHTNQRHPLVETGTVQPESEASLDDPHKENYENLGPRETEPDLQVLDHTLLLHTESDTGGENLQEKNLHLGNNPAEFKTYTRRKNPSSGVQTH